MHRYTLLAHKADGFFLMIIPVILGFMQLVLLQESVLTGDTDKTAVFMPITAPKIPEELLRKLQTDPKTLDLQYFRHAQGLLNDDEVATLHPLLQRLRSDATIPDAIVITSLPKNTQALRSFLSSEKVVFQSVYNPRKFYYTTWPMVLLTSVCVLFFYAKNRLLKQRQAALQGTPIALAQLQRLAVLHGFAFWVFVGALQWLLVVGLTYRRVALSTTLFASTLSTLPFILLTIFLTKRIIITNKLGLI